jgi:hypothetical protein
MRAAVAAALVVAACLGTAGSASANIRAELQRFAECPFDNPNVGGCLYSATNSGEFVVGNGKVPISRTIILQAGIAGAGLLVPPEHGDMVSKTPLPIPGGLVGIELPGNFTEVTATAELAGTAFYHTSIELPLKVKLDNPLNLVLGSNCYIGSEAEPISLHLTYEKTNPPPPNEPISGNVKLEERGPIAVLTGTLVDNAFAAPGANGCTVLPPVGDLAVDTKEGLPAAAGHNTAIMTGVTELANAAFVKNVLPTPELGRCTKLPGKGFWQKGCGFELAEETGTYAWAPGPGAGSKFSGVSKGIKLETAGKQIIKCEASTSEGQWTGTKTSTMAIKLTNCKDKKAVCQSSGAAAGEIRTAALNGFLDFILEKTKAETPIVGIDLSPASGPNLASFECNGTAMSLSGSVIVPITVVDKPEAEFHEKATETAGQQIPESFEEGPKDTLTLTTPSGAEQVGLAGTITLKNEEPLEVKALPN